MTSSLISEIGTIAINTTDLDTAITNAVDILGLRLTAEDNGVAYLSAADVHHELVYKSSRENDLDHIGLVARNIASLQEIHARITARGYTVFSNRPLVDGIEEGFSFVGPEGFTFQIYRGMESEHPPVHSPGFGPDRYGHINIHPRNLGAMKDFLVDVFGFFVSDIIGDDYAYFLRCNSDHHGIALIKGNGTIHHHAWQTQSLSDLGRLGDRLDGVRRNLIWGPVRHGAGHNLAAYFEDPSGMLIELYSDMEQIYDELRPPIKWDDSDHRWYNRWMGQYRPASFRDFGISPVRR